VKQYAAVAVQSERSDATGTQAEVDVLVAIAKPDIKTVEPLEKLPPNQ
jgi:hypothetical protein